MRYFCRPACLVTALVLGALVPAGADLPGWNDEVRADWFRRHPDPATWPEETARIHQNLLAFQRERGLRGALGQSSFTGWATHLYWLRLFPENFQRHPWWSSAANRNAFFALSREPVLPRLLLFSLKDGDHPAAALEVLTRIYAADVKRARAYPKLAVAYAVVFDQPIPEPWPHPFVKREAIPIGDLEPERRFTFYLDSLDKKLLMHDPRMLSVQELTFAVDSYVKLDELRRVQKIKVTSIKKLPRVYHSVKYNWSRIQQAHYIWPEPVYGLSQIAKSGGICADQAYFVAQTAKARGVPVIPFLGQGRSGDHAWIGYLQRPGRWELDFARYKGEDYPAGYAWDPQTGKKITDADVAFLNQDLTRKVGYGKARTILIWAALNRDDPSYRELVRMARGHIPKSPETWELEEAWLREHVKDPREHAAFWQAWTLNFRDVRSYRFRGQIMLLRVLRQHGNAAAAERLEKEIIRENRSGRFDLGIQLAADKIFDLQKWGRWEEAEREMAATMRRFKARAGGHLFYDLLRPYLLTCVESRQYQRAQDGLDYLGKGFNVKPRSILGNDMRDLKRQVQSMNRR